MSSRGQKRKNEESTNTYKKRDEEDGAQNMHQEKDWISGLADVCLIEIFRNFTRPELYVAQQVNKRMCAIINGNSFDSAKWQKGYLTIFPISNGYGFKYCIEDKKHPALAKRSNKHAEKPDSDDESDASEDESDKDNEDDEEMADFEDNFHETAETEAPMNEPTHGHIEGDRDDVRDGVDGDVNEFDDRDTYQYEIETDEQGTVHETKSFVEFRTWKKAAEKHDLPIPDQFFVVLRELLVRHHTSFLHLEDISFDGDSIEKLQHTMKGQRVKWCMLFGKECGPRTRDDALKFAQFLNATKTRKVTFTQSERVVERGLIDEQFLLQVEPNLKRLEVKLDDNSFSREPLFHQGRFHATTAILPVISQFRTLNLPCLILKADWLIEQFKAFLLATSGIDRVETTWRIASDADITGTELEQHFDQDHYSITSHGTHHCIAHLSGRTVKFQAEHELEQTQNGLFLPYDIDFYDCRAGIIPNEPLVGYFKRHPWF